MKELYAQYKNWKDVPMPDIISVLPQDERGYPIPVNVVWMDNKPIFKANDFIKELQLVKDFKCTVTAARLDKDTTRLVTSPLNGLRDNILCLDGPIHVEALEYSLKVCPYLCLGQYYKGFSLELADKLSKKHPGYEFQSRSPVSTVPPFMVAIHPVGFQIVGEQDNLFYQIPDRHVISREYWRHGKIISRWTAADLLNNYLEIPEIKNRLIKNGLDRKEFLQNLLT